MSKLNSYFKWRHFSWKKMCWMSLVLFLFFIGWRFLLFEDASKELSAPRLFRHIGLAIFMGFLYAFQKPRTTE